MGRWASGTEVTLGSGASEGAKKVGSRTPKARGGGRAKGHTAAHVVKHDRGETTCPKAVLPMTQL